MPLVPAFVPAVVEAQSADETVQTARHPKKRWRSKAPAVELEIHGVAVKIGRGANAGGDCRGDRSAAGHAMVGPGAGARAMVAMLPAGFSQGTHALAALVGADPVRALVP